MSDGDGGRMSVAYNFDDCLRYDPFAGDIVHAGEAVCFGDRIVTVRKNHWCHMCGCGIGKGTKTRLAVWLWMGEVVTYRWCEECCVAMARDVAVDGCGFTAKRYQLRPAVDANA